MSRAFKGRYVPEPLNNGQDLRDQMRQEATNVIQSQSVLGSMVPRSIPHDTVRTEHTRVYYSPTSAGNYTISATSATEVDATNLAGLINCSGADVLVKVRIRGVTVAATGGLFIGVTWEGTAVESGGQWSSDSNANQGVSFFTVITSPRPGQRRFALCAHRATANGTIYSGAGNSIELLATEL